MGERVQKVRPVGDLGIAPPEHLFWPAWRLILKGVPLRDLDTYYTLSDVLDHNDALDVVEELERLAHERAMHERKRSS